MNTADRDVVVRRPLALARTVPGLTPVTQIVQKPYNNGLGDTKIKRKTLLLRNGPCQKRTNAWTGDVAISFDLFERHDDIGARPNRRGEHYR